MSITTTQTRTVQAILNLFETSQVRGDYGRVTVIPRDTGHLSFGRSQTTLGAGGLYTLLAQYCANRGARFGHRLRPWLARVETRDVSLDNDHTLQHILRATADAPVMRDPQDAFFDAEYFAPAMRTAARAGISEPLGCAVVYDGYVQGSWSRLAARVSGTSASRGERDCATTWPHGASGWRRARAATCAPRCTAWTRLRASSNWGSGGSNCRW